MSEQPKRSCWVVATHWSCGTSGLSFCYASDEVGAAGLGVMQTLRNTPTPTGEMISILVRELTAAALRQMLQIVESGQPSGAVLSLVPTAPMQGQHSWPAQLQDSQATSIGDKLEPEPPATA